MASWSKPLPQRLQGLVILLAVIAFAALNLAADRWLKGAALDLTEEGVYSLSPGTLEILDRIEEPITFKLYVSPSLSESNPGIAALAKRVREMLELYEERAKGGIRLELYRPQPFSPEEDQAVAEGVTGLLTGLNGELAYFGLTAFNSVDQKETIPAFDPLRERFLEYDLTRIVASLARPDKPVVAFAGGLEIGGDQTTRFQPYPLHERLSEFYDLRSLQGNWSEVPEEAGVLLLLQPDALTDGNRYAIDQFVMRGGRVIAFIDPFLEYKAAFSQDPFDQPSAIEAMRPLLQSWGVAVSDDEVVADRQLARRVSAQVRGRQVIADYVAWLAAGPQSFDPDEPSLARLKLINFASVGEIAPLPGASTDFQPLISSSAESLMLSEKELVRPDPQALLGRFMAPGQPKALAARVSGPVKSAFPEGPPEGLEPAGEHLSESREPAEIVIVADADMLIDAHWRQRTALGALPTANNADFLDNLLDNMAGGGELVSLRGRGLGTRPFTLVEELQRAASDRYQAEESRLRERVLEIQEELRKSRELAGEAAGREQAEADLRSELLESRRQLREVQRALREDVERLSFRVALVNTWAAPALIALGALLLAVWRRSRRKPDGSARS